VEAGRVQAGDPPASLLRVEADDRVEAAGLARQFSEQKLEGAGDSPASTQFQ